MKKIEPLHQKWYMRKHIEREVELYVKVNELIAAFNALHEEKKCHKDDSSRDMQEFIEIMKEYHRNDRIQDRIQGS